MGTLASLTGALTGTLASLILVLSAASLISTAWAGGSGQSYVPVPGTWTGSCYASPSVCSAQGADTITGRGITCPDGYFQNKGPSCTLFNDVFPSITCFPASKNTYEWFSGSVTFQQAGKACEDASLGWFNPTDRRGGALPHPTHPNDKGELKESIPSNICSNGQDIWGTSMCSDGEGCWCGGFTGTTNSHQCNNAGWLKGVFLPPITTTPPPPRRNVFLGQQSGRFRPARCRCTRTASE